MTNHYSEFKKKFIKFDFYGSKPQFQIRQLETFKTIFGSLLSILSVIVTILAIGYFSLEMFDVSNPQLVFSTRNLFSPPLFNLDNNTYGFAFGLQNAFTYNQFIDESIYRAEAYQMTGKRDKNGIFNWVVNQLELETCKINKFPTEYNQIFNNLPFNNYYCLKNTSFSLFGTFLNEEYQYIMLKFYECKNSTLEINDVPNNNGNKILPKAVICKPKSLIDEMLAGTFFSLAHTDLTLDPSNYTHPNQIYAGDSYTTVSNKFFKEMHHYLKIINLETDKGWLITDIHRNQYLQLDYIKEMTDFRKAENFLSYTIKLSTRIETYSRSYLKVQNVAANAGGFLKMISIVCLILSYYYNKTKFYEFIASELMSEKIDERNSLKKFNLRNNINSQFSHKKKDNLDANEEESHLHHLNIHFNNNSSINNVNSKKFKRIKFDNNNNIDDFKHNKNDNNLELNHNNNLKNENLAYNSNSSKRYLNYPILNRITLFNNTKTFSTNLLLKKNEELIQELENNKEADNIEDFKKLNINDNILCSSMRVSNNKNENDLFNECGKEANYYQTKHVCRSGNLPNISKSNLINTNIHEKNNFNSRKNKYFSNITLPKNNMNNIYSNINLNSNNLNNNYDIKENKTKRIFLNLSFCESFWFYLCFTSDNTRTKNSKYYKLSMIKDKTDELLDIVKLFKSFNDLDRLKKIILNENQLHLFNLPFFIEVDFMSKYQDHEVIFKKLIENMNTNKHIFKNNYNV